jgi:hypothetical protein
MQAIAGGTGDGASLFHPSRYKAEAAARHVADWFAGNHPVVRLHENRHSCIARLLVRRISAAGSSRLLD